MREERSAKEKNADSVGKGEKNAGPNTRTNGLSPLARPVTYGRSLVACSQCMGREV